MELVIKKCIKCGALVEVLEDCNCENCGIKCCGEKMVELKPNIEDSSIENHITNYEIIDNEILVKVNHVMEENHHIEWIIMVDGSNIYKKKINTKDITATFPYKKGSKIYSYCNKHGLWSNDVK